MPSDRNAAAPLNPSRCANLEATVRPIEDLEKLLESMSLEGRDDPVLVENVHRNEDLALESLTRPHALDRLVDLFPAATAGADEVVAETFRHEIRPDADGPAIAKLDRLLLASMLENQNAVSSVDIESVHEFGKGCLSETARLGDLHRRPPVSRLRLGDLLRRPPASRLRLGNLLRRRPVGLLRCEELGDSSDQLARLEGRAHQADHAESKRLLLVIRCDLSVAEHQNGNGTVYHSAQLREDLEAILLREVQIENHEIGMPPEQDLESLAPIMGDQRLVTLGFEGFGVGITNRAILLGTEYGDRHRGASP